MLFISTYQLQHKLRKVSAVDGDTPLQPPRVSGKGEGIMQMEIFLPPRNQLPLE